MRIAENGPKVEMLICLELKEGYIYIYICTYICLFAQQACLWGSDGYF